MVTLPQLESVTRSTRSMVTGEAPVAVTCLSILSSVAMVPPQPATTLYSQAESSCLPALVPSCPIFLLTILLCSSLTVHPTTITIAMSSVKASLLEAHTTSISSLVPHPPISRLPGPLTPIWLASTHSFRLRACTLAPWFLATSH